MCASFGDKRRFKSSTKDVYLDAHMSTINNFAKEIYPDNLKFHSMRRLYLKLRRFFLGYLRPDLDFKFGIKWKWNDFWQGRTDISEPMHGHLPIISNSKVSFVYSTMPRQKNISDIFKYLNSWQTILNQFDVPCRRSSSF